MMNAGEDRPSLVGQQLGSYRILSLLGAGGMGEVYRALDTKLNRPVAIKFLSEDLADTTARRRFQREAQLASSLNHPHILTVHDAGEFEGRQYLVTEFVDGGTLKEWARSERRTWRQAVELLVGVADGVAAAHAAGIFHRDIKPENILVATNGYAKLSDFGLAKLEESSAPEDVTRTVTDGRTRPGVIVGTIAYMSPEQASGKPLDARSDIFSFGVVLYEMLAERRPFTGSTDLEVLQTVIHGAPAPLGEHVPPALRVVVEKAMEKSPAERYQSMRELVVDLHRVSRASETPSTAKRPWIWAAVLVLVAGGAAWRLWPQPASAQIRSIAVLPLRNLSADPNQEYFSDGTTEALISNLAQIRALKVISRTSMMRYKGTTKSMPEIGRELGVDAVVEGSVQRVGGRVRVSTQLIKASTDAHLWAQDYEREMADMLRLESDVARAIAQEIRVQITPQETTRLSSTRRIQPAAQEQYLLGRYHFWRESDAGRRQAVEYFEQAINLQQDYAAAHAGLSLAWHMLEATGAVKAREADGPARRAALKAIELDPNLAEAHVGMAGFKWFQEWDWSGADQSFRRALELNPDSMEVCLCYTLFLWTTGRSAEAVAMGERSVTVNPLSDAAQSSYGRALFAMRRYEEAVFRLQQVLQLNAQNARGRRFLARAYEQTGKLQDALALFDRPEFRPSPDLALIYALLGRREDALKMEQALAGQASDPEGIARVYFALGAGAVRARMEPRLVEQYNDRGFQWLTRAFDERQLFVSFVKFDPAFDSVRSDPRFEALVARLKLPN